VGNHSEEDTAFDDARGAETVMSPAPVHHPLLMADSIDVEALPVGCDAYAGYTGGRWPTYHALCQRFPNALLVSIAVTAHGDGMILDVEQGDATVADAVAWVKRWHAAGVELPGIYCALATAGTAHRALDAAGIPRNRYKLWVAHWNGRRHVCNPECGLGMTTYAGATQWRGPSEHEPWDVSAATREFLPPHPGRAPTLHGW
jgi:hypothetical protein